MKRIEVLDGFRAIAILMVICYHYFSRWPDFYPYGSAYSAPFAHGYLGVWLFFMISGFVIALTLETCATPMEFIARRIARLWPPMLLCSAITFCVLTVFPRFFKASAINFIPSLTFIDPEIFSILGLISDSMDGAYWSLYVEVRFYLWAGLLFFAFRRLPLAFLVMTNVVALADFCWHGFFIGILFIPQYLPTFGIGLGFYYLYKNKADLLARLLIVNSSVLGLIYLEPEEWGKYAIFIALFALFILKSKFLTPLTWKPIRTIGEASYSLYLLHQFVGVTLIGLLGPLAAFPVAILMILLSIMIYRYWELPARNFLRNHLLARPGKPRSRANAAG